MRRWQDELYEATGKTHGLERVGVRRMRLSRADYMARENAAKHKADAEAEAREILAKASAESKLPAQRMADANKAHRQLVSDAKVLESERLRFAQEPRLACTQQRLPSAMPKRRGCRRKPPSCGRHSTLRRSGFGSTRSGKRRPGLAE